MGKRDVNDFPFAYLTEDQSPNPSRRPADGVRLRNDRSGRSGTREIEKLLIISIVLTVVFLVLLTITFLVGLNRDGDPGAETTVVSAQKAEESASSSLQEQEVTSGPSTTDTQETEQTGLSVIHLG